ncbi:hypothetical protein GCM10011344_00620 [Dokdonia pacifica]|uniref:Uncharacterized protein n=1 Tax=Dokdonia pacifica TaxID=1627892 RepID=A0A239D2I7_9FLAO|nr:hypothetical protein [Dokdonia pacifica]GGG04099.1 hypothetical protein GCM10011344_00620 [Dokdonia pacifica]SNS25813.1 hypothetical protein SAMN06265376_10978 [Dokdonia pacifica]
MNKKYKILLNGQEIGTTQLEKADAPMGVVSGQIKSTIQNFGYKFIKDFCRSNQIEIADDYPEDKLISTMTIDSLIIKNESDTVIKGIGNQISGMDSEGFEITILGISYPFYEEEFPHHVKAYNEMFK